jgi:hypothetical protein
LLAELLLVELFPDALFDDVVAGFFFCAVVVPEPCAYPTATAAHSTTPAIHRGPRRALLAGVITHRQPNPKPFVTIPP